MTRAGFLGQLWSDRHGGIARSLTSLFHPCPRICAPLAPRRLDTRLLKPIVNGSYSYIEAPGDRPDSLLLLNHLLELTWRRLRSDAVFPWGHLGLLHMCRDLHAHGAVVTTQPQQRLRKSSTHRKESAWLQLRSEIHPNPPGGSAMSFSVLEP
jgi:hypothetical protein